LVGVTRVGGCIIDNEAGRQAESRRSMDGWNDLRINRCDPGLK